MVGAMRTIALATLFHERKKLVGSVLAVAAVVTLVLLQAGLHRGFRRSASQIVRRVGGDAWVHQKGTRTFDDAQPIAPTAALDTACVTHERRVVVDFAQAKRKDDVPVSVEVVGIEPRAGHEVPWDVVEGDPSRISDTVVAVDRLDAEELGVSAIGDALVVNGVSLTVGAFTRGVRPFTLTPYVFVRPEGANRILRLPPGTSTYRVVDVARAGCLDRAVAAVSADLRATASADFARATERRWVEDSGIGLMLLVGAALSLFVGALVLAQTLHALVTDHKKELATLAALGSTPRELSAFVAWQAAVLALLGGGLGAAVAFGLAHALVSSGVAVVLDGAALALGLGGALVVVTLASFFAARPIFALDPTEVLS